MENNIPKRIFIDMDGVLVDFHAGVSDMLGRPLTSDDFGHSEYDERKEELTNKRLFAKLPPMVDYHELIGYVNILDYLGKYLQLLVQLIETL